MDTANFVLFVMLAFLLGCVCVHGHYNKLRCYKGCEIVECPGSCVVVQHKDGRVGTGCSYAGVSFGRRITRSGDIIEYCNTDLCNFPRHLSPNEI